MKRGPWTAALATLLVFLTAAVEAMDTEGAIDQLAAQVGQVMPDGRGVRVVVTDFTDGKGVTSDYGRRVAHLLILRLGFNPRLMPVEWNVLGLVLSELNLKRSDLATLENARRLAKQFGADVVVVGSLTDLGAQVALDTRVLDIASGETLGFASAAVAKDAKVTRMLETGRQ